MIYKGSRLEKCHVFEDAELGVQYLDIPDMSIKERPEDISYQVKDGDRLDILAKRFYNNPQKKWIILHANPKYNSELDIKTGDVISIPHPDRRDL